MPAPGWERFEGFLWSTTSLLVLAEGESLVVDPAISEREVAGIGRRALELGAPVRHVLITHGDWDHVCRASTKRSRGVRRSRSARSSSRRFRSSATRPMAAASGSVSPGS
jgi:glyoxylase-like metal-dependent hydrolase (beta-lactamase superfamily II)